jgi:hypothetical protein
MDNGMMSESTGAADIFAMTKHMWKGLENIIAAAAALAVVAKSTGSIKRDGIQASAVKKSPISKAGVEAGLHHMVGFTPKAGDRICLALIGFFEQALQVSRAEGHFEETAHLTTSSRMDSCLIRFLVRTRYEELQFTSGGTPPPLDIHCTAESASACPYS